MVISGENYDETDSDEVWDNMIIDVARVSGTIPMPTRQKTPEGVTITFTASRPRSGDIPAFSWEAAADVIK